MTREEAIQKRIDDIMDYFDFDRVYTMMRAVDWVWFDEKGTPEIPELRVAARECMRGSIAHVSELPFSVEGFRRTYLMSAGFAVYIQEYKGDDEQKPWIDIALYFGVNDVDDGIEYDPEPK